MAASPEVWEDGVCFHEQGRKTALNAKRFTPVMAAAVALAACGPQTADVDDPAYDSMLRYCERFAAAAPDRLLKSPGAHYIAGSARVFRTRLDDIVTCLSNTFQPLDSRFAAAWQCTFSISMDGQPCAGEVTLPIAEHAEFAEYTSWPRLAIVDDNRIVTSGGSTIGFATPKYFETSCPVEGDGTEGWQKNP